MVTVRDVLRIVAERTGHSVEDVMTRKDLVLYRQVACYVSSRQGRSLVHIARVLRKDHKTVCYAIQRVAHKMGTDLQLQTFVAETEKQAWNILAARRVSSAPSSSLMAPSDAASTVAAFMAMTIVRTGNPQT